MNKKLFLIIVLGVACIFTLPTQAETTGDTGTGTNITGNCYPVISGLKISIVCDTGNTNTGNVNPGTGAIIDQNIATGGLLTGQLLTGSEFQQALAWMYANGLTKYSNTSDYRAEDGLTREEAAKIIGQAFITLGYNQSVKNNTCSFLDSNQVDPSLSGFVINTCKRGIFKGTTDNKFLPTEKLTRPQAIALLVRIFEGKVSYENKVPRWGDYYIKGQALGLTTLTNQTIFDSPITRKEIAIYIYRFKNIVSNETIKIMMASKLAELESTGTNFNSGMLSNFGSLANSLSINNDPELLEAIRWMNDNGLTNYTTISDYKPFEILNREQAAKIISLFAGIYNLGTNTIGSLPSECIFKDISDADGSLILHIEQVCKLGVMKGSNEYFNPKSSINKSSFIVAIIRLLEGKKLDENVLPRWKNYFEKAQELGMIGPADAVTFENPITRYELALFLYNFKVKYQILQNLNNNNIQNQIVSTVPGSTKTGINNMFEANVYVDMNLLQNGNFDVGYIETFGQRYKVVRSNTEKYFTDNFIRYGDLFSLDKEEKIGTCNFIVNNFSLIEGTIRIGNSTFNINTINNTNAYYKITQTK